MKFIKLHSFIQLFDFFVIAVYKSCTPVVPFTTELLSTSIFSFQIKSVHLHGYPNGRAQSLKKTFASLVAATLLPRTGITC